MVDLFLELSRLADALFSINIAGMSMISWFVLFWVLAIIGWILQIMYGRKER